MNESEDQERKKNIKKSPSAFLMTEKGVPSRLAEKGVSGLNLEIKKKVEPFFEAWLAQWDQEHGLRPEKSILVVGELGEPLIPIVADAIYRRGFTFSCVSQLNLEDVVNESSFMLSEDTLKTSSVLFMHKFALAEISDWKAWSVTKKILFHRFDEGRPTLIFTSVPLEGLEKVVPLQMIDLLKDHYDVVDVRLP